MTQPGQAVTSAVAAAVQPAQDVSVSGAEAAWAPSLVDVSLGTSNSLVSIAKEFLLGKEDRREDERARLEQDGRLQQAGPQQEIAVELEQTVEQDGAELDLTERQVLDEIRNGQLGNVTEGIASLQQDGLNGSEIFVHQEMVQEEVREFHSGPAAQGRESIQELELADDSFGFDVSALTPGQTVPLPAGEEIIVADEQMELDGSGRLNGRLFTTENTTAIVQADGSLEIASESSLEFEGKLDNDRGTSIAVNRGQMKLVVGPNQYTNIRLTRDLQESLAA